MMPKIAALLFFLLFFAPKLIQNSPLNFENARPRRQAPFDELIQSALQLVRPIFGSAKSIAKGVVNQQESPIMGKKPREQPRLSSAHLRELDILGLGQSEVMLNEEGGMGMPQICQGNSRICKFIACTAHNFKQDQNFANIQLATQLLADKKLRRTVGANAGAIGDVCREQGMSSGQCALFSRAFQLIDRFMSTIEDEAEKGGGVVEGASRENGGGREDGEEKIHPNGKFANRSVSKIPTKIETMIKPKMGGASSPTTTTPTTPQMRAIMPTSSLSTDNIFEPLDDEPADTPRRSPAIVADASRGGGSRTWSVQRHHPPPPSPSPPPHLSPHLDIAANRVANGHLRPPPPPPPLTPPRLFDTSSSSSTGSSAHQQQPTPRRRLVTYNTMVPMQMLRTEMNGTALLITKQTAPTAQTVPLGRPKQQFSSAAGTTSAQGQQQQQIGLEQRPPIKQRFVSQKSAAAGRSSQSIPEAEEFAEEDAAAAENDLEMLDNELSNWMMTSLRDDGAADYYDGLAGEAEKPRQNGRGNETNREEAEDEGGGGGEYSADDDDDGGGGRQKVPTAKQRRQQMDNCLQYLG